MSILSPNKDAATTLDGRKVTLPFFDIDNKGRIPRTDGSVTAYFVLPLASYESRTDEERVDLGRPVMRVLEHIGRLGKPPVGESRRGAKAREFHLVSYSWDAKPLASPDIPDRLREAQERWFLSTRATHRALLLGIDLWRADEDEVLGTQAGAVERWKLQLADSVERLFSGYRPNMADFETDWQRLAEAVAVGGGKPLDGRFPLERARLTAWYSDGHDGAEWIEETPDGAGLVVDPQGLNQTIRLYGFAGMSPELSYAPWVPFAHVAMANEPGVGIVSIKGKLEHSAVTRSRAHRTLIHARAVAAEEASVNDLRIEDREQQVNGHFVEDYYAQHSGEFAVTEASILFGETLPAGVRPSGQGWRERLEANFGIRTVPLRRRQMSALVETLPGAKYRVAPYRPFNNDFNAGFIAYAALNAATALGDPKGYHVGRNLPEFQPIYLDQERAATENSNATFVITGSLGSGKTFLSLILAIQSWLEGKPVIFINPKNIPSYKYLADRLGWAYVPLEPSEGTRGLFDPFRFAETDVACDILLEYLLGLFSVKEGLTARQEGHLDRAMQLAREHQVGCAGEVIDLIPDADLRSMIADILDGSPVAGVAVAKERSTVQRFKNDFKVRDGFKGMLVEFGPELAQPVAGQEARNIKEATSVAVLRLITRISTEILTQKRTGMLLVDEAAGLFDGSPATLSMMRQLSRRVRSYGVLLGFMTQNVTDITGHKMDSFVGRWFILGTESEDERRAALEVCRFPAEATDILDRLRPENANPRPAGGEHPLGRPAFGIHRDIDGRSGTMLVTPVPEELRYLLSTNPKDDEKRRAASTT